MSVLPLCNGLSERAPHIGQLVFPLCWRCTGVFLGLIIFTGIAFIFNLSGLTCMLTTFLCLPALIDVCRQKYFNYNSNNEIRFITGLLLGASTVGISTLIVSITYHILGGLL